MDNTRKLVLGAAAFAAVLTLGIATPAKADWDRDHRGRPQWRDHGYHDRGWHRGHHKKRVVYYQAPRTRYVYSPPPVVYYPPPPTTGINLVLPLYFD
ncbi:MAG: hypothetical protein WAO98_01035 [Alphaproteobacteria bacterium]